MTTGVCFVHGIAQDRGFQLDNWRVWEQGGWRHVATQVEPHTRYFSINLFGLSRSHTYYIYNITKASCQAWLKLLFANEVRIGGPGGGRFKTDHFEALPQLNRVAWSILRLMYQVAIG
jgi:hypothetical protein